MVLKTRKHKISFEVDEDDFDRVSKHTWACDSIGYVITTINGEAVRLHRFIMGFPEGLSIDHIDGNRLNNRKSNLRICTHAQNMCNQKFREGGSSRYKGVAWHARGKKWVAQITVEYRNVYLGLFATEEEAAKAYNIAALKHHGEFARINELEEINT